MRPCMSQVQSSSTKERERVTSGSKEGRVQQALKLQCVHKVPGSVRKHGFPGPMPEASDVVSMQWGPGICIY